MPNLPISGLPGFVSPAATTDLLAIVQNLASTPVTRKISYSSLITEILNSISPGFVQTNPSANQTIATHNLTLTLGTLQAPAFALHAATSGLLGTISVLATLTQATAFTVPDPGTSSASFILSNSIVRQTITCSGGQPGFTIIASATPTDFDQFSVADLANTNFHIGMGANASMGIAGVFAGNAGVGFIPLCLHPYGGSYVGIGSNGNQTQLNIFPATVNSGSFNLVAVNSTANFTSTLSNGNVGQNTTYNFPDPGVSTTKIILSNSPTFQNILSPMEYSSYGYYGAISTPSTPSGGADIYSRTVSGTTNLYGLNSAGVETQLTGLSPGGGYWTQSGTTLFPTTPGDTLIIKADEANSQPQIQIAGQTDPVKQLNLYLNTTNNVGVLNARRAGTAYPLFLSANSSAGALGVAIGFPETTAGLTETLNVNGGISTYNGNIVAGKGGAGNSGSLTSIANDTSKIIIAAGAMTSPFNIVISNRSFGQSTSLYLPDPGVISTNFLLADSATIQTVTTGNLGLAAGYMNYGAISLPSTPTASANIYARTVAGTTDLYALNSAGTEVNLTGGSSSSYWTPITYNTFPLLQPTSNSQVGVYFSSSGIEGAIYNDGGNYMRHYFNSTEVLAYNGSQFDVIPQANFFANIIGLTAGATISYPVISSQGITGATAASRYVGATATTQPTSGAFAQGDFLINQTYGTIYTCVAGGSFGSWAMVGTPLLATGSTSGLAPLTSVQVTIGTGSPYMASILGLTVNVVEGTTNLPLMAKIVSYVVGPPSTITVEIYNASATLTTGTIQIKVFSTGF